MQTPNKIVLSKHIAAIQVESSEEEGFRSGRISQLPKGAELIVCGNGFSKRTAKIECDGQFYFVFLQDIALPDQQYDYL
jgi:hypothetical protein